MSGPDDRFEGDTGAVIVGPYRYALWRQPSPGAYVTFIGLNPSTADAVDNDATIRKCLGFARRWGATGIRMVNLFAWRSRDPAPLRVMSMSAAIGPENDEWVARAILGSSFVVAAWGSTPMPGIMGRVAELRAYLRPAGFDFADLRVIGLTRDGDPRHPSRAPYFEDEPPRWSRIAHGHYQHLREPR